MVKKVFSIVLILACLFMLVAGAFGIKDILQEKSDGEKNKAETLEKLDTLKAGVAELEKNRAAYEEGLKAYEDGTAEYEQGQKDLEAGEADYEAGKIKIANGKVALAAGQKEYDTSLAQYNYTVNNRDTVIDQKTEEYINAKKFLADHEAIVDYIYNCAVSDFYVEGGVYTDNRIICQIKFIGKEKLMSIVEELVSKEGY